MKLRQFGHENDDESENVDEKVSRIVFGVEAGQNESVYIRLIDNK